MRGERIRRNLYFIRHAQYCHRHDQPGQPDGPLTDHGREQAQLTAQRLRALPISIIHHSDLERTTETAQIIARALPNAEIRVSSILRECIPSLPPLDNHSDDVRHFFQSLPPHVVEDGARQLEHAAGYYLTPSANESHEVIVSHGNIICALIARALRAPTDAWLNLDIHHCGISQLVITTPGSAVLLCHSDTGHLPPQLRTHT